MTIEYDIFLSLVNKKLCKLANVMEQTQPINILHLHPFDCYKSKIKIIIDVIDKLTKEAEIEKERLLNKNLLYKKDIQALQNKINKDIATESELDDNTKNEDNKTETKKTETKMNDKNLFVNYHLEYELLKNEEEKTMFEIKLVEYKMKSLVDEIESIKKWTCNEQIDMLEHKDTCKTDKQDINNAKVGGKDVTKRMNTDEVVYDFAEIDNFICKITKNKIENNVIEREIKENDTTKNNIDDNKNSSNIKFDEVSSKNYEKLKEIVNELQKIKIEKEKKREMYYKFIMSGYEEMGIEKYNKIDDEIINNFYSVNINSLYKRYCEIQNEIEKRKCYVKEIIKEIEKLEVNLEGHVSIEKCSTEINNKNIEKLNETKNYLIVEEEKHFESIFNEVLEELSEICTVFDMEMLKFDKNKENLEIMKKIIDELKNKKDMYIEITKLMKKREEIKNRMIEFEKNASDPKRLFKSSFQLVSEEKFRKNAVPNLLKVEELLLKKVVEYENSFEALFIKGDNYRNYLENEIKNRIINKTVFIMNKQDTPRKQEKRV
ncbi:hypothetical protein BDAP_001323 [Binucleata daphniae]